MYRFIFERSLMSNVVMLFSVACMFTLVKGAVDGPAQMMDTETSFRMNPGYVATLENKEVLQVSVDGGEGAAPTYKDITPELLNKDGSLKARVTAINTLFERELEMEQWSTKQEQAQQEADRLAEHLLQIIHQEAIEAADNLNVAAADVYRNMESLGIVMGSRLKPGVELLPEYTEIVQRMVDRHNAGATYKINADLVKAVMMQESGGKPGADNGYAKGIMQLEYTVVPSFIKYGKEAHGETWTEADRLDAEKCIDYGVYVLVGYLNHYEGDYIKALQAYNYSHYSLDKLIGVYGDAWMENRSQMARLNNKSSYGDSLYVEHVLSYYPG